MSHGSRQQLGGILGSRGNAAWRKAKSNVEGVISDAEAKGMEAVDAVREVGDNMVDAIDESLKKRPYTTLALALTLGFRFRRHLETLGLACDLATR